MSNEMYQPEGITQSVTYNPSGLANILRAGVFYTAIGIAALSHSLGCTREIPDARVKGGLEQKFDAHEGILVEGGEWYLDIRVKNEVPELGLNKDDRMIVQSPKSAIPEQYKKILQDECLKENMAGRTECEIDLGVKVSSIKSKKPKKMYLATKVFNITPDTPTLYEGIKKKAGDWWNGKKEGKEAKPEVK